MQILTEKLRQDISIHSSSSKHSIAVRSSQLGVAWDALALLQEDRAGLTWLSSELLAKIFIPLLASEQALSVTDNATEAHAEELRELTFSHKPEAGIGGRETGIVQCSEFLQGHSLFGLDHAWSCISPSLRLWALPQML